MFKKNKCSNCKKTVEEKYSFCPYCGNKIFGDEENNDDWGMLGKNDLMPSMNEIKLPMGLNSIFNSLMKKLSKEMDEQLKSNFRETETPKKVNKEGISISISTFGNGPPKIKVTQMGGKSKIVQTEKKEKSKQNSFTREKIKEFSSLPREEPETNVRRLSDIVIYELEMPGVKSTEDVSIIKLENSIEIKAIGKKKAYAKIIPISLPIKDYSLSDGKLTLELGEKN
jgi:HSP20 family molecular chaperone IbpA